MSKMEPRGRLGAALGKGERERERGLRCAWRGAGAVAGIGTTAPEAPPEDPGHRARQQPPRWPGKTAERPAGGGTQRATWPRPRTERAKRLETESSAHLRGDTAQEDRPTQEGEGPGHQAGTMIEGPQSPKGPQVANKPECAERCVSRFQGDAGVKFLMDNIRQRQSCVCTQWIG